ncbi:DUF2567 domain-containing protein [Nocardia arthritidis]|uniref:DUF2567 domain-containing protein n=1 Tax=Nocardia arthritidis TaxID=228602 RepID=UPI001EE9FAFE|nr:DUF2567 domain-containing protein [Nocardia arthritidis]
MGAREVRAGVFIVGAILLASAVGGALWGWLAPAEQFLVVEPGRGAALTGESVHQFDAVAVFLLIGAVTGFLSAAAAWRWRGARGPVMQLALLVGSFAGAVVMGKFGEQVAQWLHQRPHDPAVGQIVSLPPELGTWPAYLIQPLVVSLVVFFLAVLSPTEDLGTGNYRWFGDPESPDAAGTYEPYPVYTPYGPVGDAGVNTGTDSR